MRPVFAALVLLAPLSAYAEAPPACPKTMGVVERTVGAPLIYLPAQPSRPETCRLVQRGGEIADFYYATWRTDWPGAEQALPALRQAYAGPPGTAVKFDVVAAPGYSWHETIRNDGFENLSVLGATYRTMKLTHEREGFDGNTYHSTITSWKDMATGMTIYQNYIHFSGQPEAGAAWNPLTITGGR